MRYPVGTKLYIVYDEPGKWSSGPMVMTPDAFSPLEWEAHLIDWRNRGCDIVTVVVESSS